MNNQLEEAAVSSGAPVLDWPEDPNQTSAVVWSQSVVLDRYPGHIGRGTTNNWIASTLTEIATGACPHNFLDKGSPARRDIEESLRRSIERDEVAQAALNGGEKCLMGNEAHDRLITAEVEELIRAADREYHRRRNWYEPPQPPVWRTELDAAGVVEWQMARRPDLDDGICPRVEES